MPTLQRDVDQRIGDRVDAAFGDQRDELRHIVVVHRMHRRQVRPRRPRTETQPLGFGGERLDVARQRVVALVAVHVDPEAAFRLRSRTARSPTRRRRPSCARNGECRPRPRPRDSRRAQGLLRRSASESSRPGERHQLQVEVGLHLAFDLDERLDRNEPVVADVDMAAHRQQPLRHREIAISQRPLGHRLMRQQRLQLAPQRNALQQSARPSSRGIPSESVASIWKCASTKGGETSRPVASMVWRVSAEIWARSRRCVRRARRCRWGRGHRRAWRSGSGGRRSSARHRFRG